MKIEIDIDPYELIKYMKSTASIGLILKELEPDEADILDYMSIEQLVQLAFDENPDQVKGNLIKIMDIRIPRIELDPASLSNVIGFIIAASRAVDLHDLMKTIKAALRDKVTILYEVK